MKRKRASDVGECWKIVGVFCYGFCSVFIRCVGFVGILCFVVCLSFCGWMLILYVHRWWDWRFVWCEWDLFVIKGNLRWWIRVRVQGIWHLSIFAAYWFVLFCDIEGEFADDIDFHKLCADEFLYFASFVALLCINFVVGYGSLSSISTFQTFSAQCFRPGVSSRRCVQISNYKAK